MSNKTAEILKGMLTENTGVAMCDSGGVPQYDSSGNYIGSQHGYGRSYERNQRRDFESAEPTSLEFHVRGDSVDISITHDVYHWLKERCQISEKYDGLFHGDFLKERDSRDKSWLQLMEEFPEWLGERMIDCEDCDGPAEEDDEEKCDTCGGTGKVDEIDPDTIGGIYGEGDPFTVNTYNGEDALSQTIQYTYFTVDKDEFIILQIHGGADVRGGYTKPRVFEVGHMSELDIFDNAKGAIYCTGEDHHPTALAIKERQERQVEIPGIESAKIDFSERHTWTTDDTCHFYYDGCCGAGAERQLEKYEAKDLEENDVWEEGKLCVKDGVAYCPYCGSKLAGGSY